MLEETQAHYDRLAPVYDQNWAYSPEFLKWMGGCILARLRVKPGDRILDLGCGTGLYAQVYREQFLTWAFVMERVTGIEPRV